MLVKIRKELLMEIQLMDLRLGKQFCEEINLFMMQFLRSIFAKQVLDCGFTFMIANNPREIANII